MKKIVQKDEKVLRKISKKVPVSDIQSKKIQTVIKNMFESLSNESDGVALAAPQIGESLRIFVISPKAFVDTTDKKLVYINPEIIKKSKDKKKMDEGCLSCRWLYGKTKRASRTSVKAYDENGEEFSVEGAGLISQIFQHEIDHLNGILFIDHAKDLQELEPSNE
jgi:peptide deformylase